MIRDVPRGHVSFGGGALIDPKDGDLLGGYTFGAGDLHGAQVPYSMNTPLAVVKAGDNDFLYLTTRDTRVRPKRYYFQAGERAFRTEAIYEHDGWRNDRRVVVPTWQLGHTATLDDAIALHMAHIERAFGIPTWESRTDVPAWMRNTALVMTMHGQHFTGFIFNDYAQQLAILRWVATKIPAARVLVFLASWDGRYYWDYPNYTVPARMGGEAGFRTLISEAQKLGLRMMPMVGTNSANCKQPRLGQDQERGDAQDRRRHLQPELRIWNNDRHRDGLAHLHESGRRHRVSTWKRRIAETIERFGVDAYFLDIVGGHVNSTNGDMHEGTRLLVQNLRAGTPRCWAWARCPTTRSTPSSPCITLATGRSGGSTSRFFSHLSAPAPGRGSSGAHEWARALHQRTLGLNPQRDPHAAGGRRYLHAPRRCRRSSRAAKTRAGIA
ncbi:MAG: hypothetical protein IPK33_05255 [Gemmatimonadetes bacterium]|nr:hypothetical protein [Gemmatimonadota bacterium]